MKHLKKSLLLLMALMLAGGIFATNKFIEYMENQDYLEQVLRKSNERIEDTWEKIRISEPELAIDHYNQTLDMQHARREVGRNDTLMKIMGLATLAAVVTFAITSLVLSGILIVSRSQRVDETR